MNLIKLHDLSPKLSVAALGLLLAVAGCKSSQTAQDQTADQSTDQTASADQGQNPSDPGDPANTNLAPIPASYTTSGASSSASQAAPPDSGSADNGGGDYSEASYNDPPEDYAPQPPPPLPEYQQPPDPGDGYLWTPGYWGYASAGYYWVPGAWVRAAL